MRIYLLHGTREQGPMGLEELRDRLDLRMVDASQPCRIAGLQGTYVVGEIVSGNLFRDWEEDDDEENAEDSDQSPEDAGEWEESGGEPEEGSGEGRRERENEDAEVDGEAGEDSAEDDEDFDDEEDSAWDLEPLWEGRPGYTAYPGQILFILLLAGASAAAFLLDWSGWLGAALVGLLCFSLALLMGKRQGTRYAVYGRRLEWTEPGFLSRTREVPRSAVHAIEMVSRFPGNLLGRADVIFVHDRPGLPEQVVFRQIPRARAVRQLWRA